MYLLSSLLSSTDQNLLEVAQKLVYYSFLLISKKKMFAVNKRHRLLKQNKNISFLFAVLSSTKSASDHQAASDRRVAVSGEVSRRRERQALHHRVRSRWRAGANVRNVFNFITFFDDNWISQNFAVCRLYVSGYLLPSCLKFTFLVDHPSSQITFGYRSTK